MRIDYHPEDVDALDARVIHVAASVEGCLVITFGIVALGAERNLTLAFGRENIDRLMQAIPLVLKSLDQYQAGRN